VGLLRPRPFLNKLSIAQSSRKFCERHSFFVDTGTLYSIFPHSSAKDPTRLLLRSPRDQSMPSLGEKQLEVCFGAFWAFLLAKVDFAILGAHFLKNFHLVTMVDLAASQLLDTRTLRRFAARPPAENGALLLFSKGLFAVGFPAASFKTWPTWRAGFRLPSTRRCTTSRLRDCPPLLAFATWTGPGWRRPRRSFQAGERGHHKEVFESLVCTLAHGQYVAPVQCGNYRCLVTTPDLYLLPNIQDLWFSCMAPPFSAS
jgi:hypothetical protein